MSDAKWGFWGVAITALAGLAGTIYQANVAREKTEESKVSSQQAKQYQDAYEALTNRYNKLQAECSQNPSPVLEDTSSVDFGDKRTPILSVSKDVRMELWTLKSDEDVNSYVEKQEQEKNPPFGLTTDSSDFFGYANHRVEKEFRSLNGKPLAFRWSGYLEIRTNGQYLFTNQIKVKNIINGNGYGYNTFSRLKISDLIVENSVQHMRQGGESEIQNRSIYLKTGKYPFELWLAVSWVQYNGYMSQYEFNPSAVEVFINQRGPNDKVPHLLTPKLLANFGQIL